MTYDYENRLSTRLKWLSGNTYNGDKLVLPDSETVGAMKLISNIIDLTDRVNHYNKPFYKLSKNQRWYLRMELYCEDRQYKGNQTTYQGIEIVGFFKGKFQKETFVFIHFWELLNDCPLNKLIQPVARLKELQRLETEPANNETSSNVVSETDRP